MKLTNVIDLVYSARQSGIDILLDGGNLQVKAPKGTGISEELLESIRTNKQQIIDLLQNDKWRPARFGTNEQIAAVAGKNNLQKIPLSFSQERLWLVEQLDGGSVQYHNSVVLRIRGALEVKAVQFALSRVVSRHEILRTVIEQEDGQPFQRILTEDDWRLSVLDQTAYGEDSAAMKAYVGQLINTPFDLSRDHKMRGVLLKIAEEEWLLVIVLHHIASDGWSTRILTREFIEYYSSYVHERPAMQDPLPIQYSDYAIWQRKHISNESLAGKIAYWKEQLAGIEPLNLPVKPGHAARPGIDGERTYRTIDQETTERVVAFARKEALTLYMYLLGIFKIVLHRYTGQNDICIGTSLAGRQQGEVERLIGFFSNTIVLRSRVDGEMSVRDLLQAIKRTALDGYDSQEVPFERVVESLNIKRETGQNPLFQVMFVLENVPESGGTKPLEGISFVPEDFGIIKAKFDITVSVMQTPKGLVLTLTYRKDLFSAAMMEQLLRHYESLLILSLSCPDMPVGALKMVSKEEAAQTAPGWDMAPVSYPIGKTVGELFEGQAIRTPEATAVAYMGEELSYGELNEWSNQLACFLREKGVGNGQLVPICAERSIKMIVGFLGIIKAGGAYVPIDPEYPGERIKYMLEDVGSQIVITDKASHAIMASNGTLTIIDLDEDWAEICGRPGDMVTAGARAHQPAYVIYTSGSTGMPKGVVISHRNIVDYVWGIRNSLGMESGLSFAWMSTIAADLGNTAIFWSLLSGGKLHIFPGWLIKDAAGLHDYFRHHPIDCLKIVPSHWSALSIDGKWLLPKKLLIFGGEVLPSQLVSAIPSVALSCRIINHYGPTETTIGKLLHIVDEDDLHQPNIPLGKPFSNTGIFLLTRELALCPPGTPGEICIGGDGLGLGYLNQPELTAEKFVPYSFPIGANSRIYRTGDLGRILPNGEIEFLGRKDDQVKIRGYRVELGEVESIIRTHPHVRQCTVIAKEDHLGYKQLAAFIVPQEIYERSDLLAWLGSRLPENMRPSSIIELESLPLTRNGKIDRRALAEIDPEAAENQEYVAPRTVMEESLAAIWQELLGVEQVGIRDNFFGLGGHSLLAIRVVTAIRRQLEIEISIGDIFDHPSIEALAEQLESRSARTVQPLLVRQPRPQLIPLSFSQERLWFIDRLEGSRQYHIPWVLRLQGELEESLLGEALRGIITRHEVLRTMIREENGEPYQLILDAAEWRLEIIDLSGQGEEKDQTRSYIMDWVGRPFDLSTDYKLRAQLLRLGGGEHLLVLVLHHIASDGWSHGILVREFMELYGALAEGREHNLKPLTIQYADYALWQRHYLQGEVLEKKLAWWKEALAGSNPLELPADRPHPVAPSRRGAVVAFRIERELSGQAQALAQQEGVTLFMLLLGVFQVLLYRYSGQGDICVGTPVANRMQHEVEGLIGFFVNTLVLRTWLGDNPRFTELLERVRQGTMGAYEHQDVPFEKVVEAVVKERDMSRSPLFQVLFVVQNTSSSADITDEGLPGVKISLGPLNAVMLKFDMTFTIAEGAEGMHGTIEYSTDLYEQKRMERMADHYVELLRSVVAGPGEMTGSLNMLGGEEKRQLLVEFGGSMEPLCDATIVDLFEEQVKRTPEGVAVIVEAGKFTYRELDERANALGHYLRRKGVREESLVGVMI
jgi:amino acid adenylation domain-containing protein